MKKEVKIGGSACNSEEESKKRVAAAIAELNQQKESHTQFQTVVEVSYDEKRCGSKDGDFGRMHDLRDVTGKDSARDCGDLEHTFEDIQGILQKESSELVDAPQSTRKQLPGE